ncbi:MAG TPA: DMT family transporter [Allosphingosinicella sp.]|nr:DMT family transporter [Allosphingosinicella sp.]
MKPHNPALAFGIAALAVATFAVMDALMKELALALGAYNALLWRTMAGAAMAGALFFATRSGGPSRSAWRFHLRRGVVGVPTAFFFFWGLARVPLAQAIALAFVAPLIALYLASVVLDEKIERKAILASLLGFAGVLVIMSGQAQAELGREAFLGSLAILASAALYAYNIILMRQQAQVAGPVEVAFFTSGIMAVGFILAAPLLGKVPPAGIVPEILAAAALGFVSLMLFSWAYARAEAQQLAPVEYSSFIWASLLGWIFFSERVQPLTLVGAAMIVAACLLAAPRGTPPAPKTEPGIPGGAA